jgi:hypothetical protein
MSGPRYAAPQTPVGDPLRWWHQLTAGSAGTERGVSLELRWFGLGEPPAELVTLTAGAPSQRRSDHYAQLGRDDVSLKVRGRVRVSIKQRRCRVPVVDGLPPAERWSRRSARSDRAEAHGSHGSLSWVTVAKRRTRTLIDLTGPVPALATAPRRLLPRGGAVELVELRLPDEELRLWSAACEAWGPGDREGLVRVIEWSAVDWAGIDREGWLAAGYPVLLRRLRPSAPSG